MFKQSEHNATILIGKNLEGILGKLMSSEAKILAITHRNYYIENHIHTYMDLLTGWATEQ